MLGKKIHVTENGWIFVCDSPCVMLRNAFEALRHELVERVGEAMMWQIEWRIASLEALSERAARTGQVTREFQKRLGEAAGAIHDEIDVAVRLPARPCRVGWPGSARRVSRRASPASNPTIPSSARMLAERGTWMHDQAYQFLRRAETSRREPCSRRTRSGSSRRPSVPRSPSLRARGRPGRPQPSDAYHHHRGHDPCRGPVRSRRQRRGPWQKLAAAVKAAECTVCASARDAVGGDAGPPTSRQGGRRPVRAPLPWPNEPRHHDGTWTPAIRRVRWPHICVNISL